jgi:transcriptional regulator with XRE-family HTH domain
MSVTFGGWLQQMREARGLSIRALAAKANLSHATISKLEDDIVGASPDTVKKIADALAVAPAEAFRVWSEDAAARQGVALPEVRYERDPDLSFIIERYEGLGPVDKRLARRIIEELSEAQREGVIGRRQKIAEETAEK